MADTLAVTRPTAVLPSVGVPSSTTKPIQYNLSAGDIAGPYTEIARAADKLSGAAEDVAIPLAQQAGRDAVRTDDQGNMIVDRLPPIIGDAAKAARLATAAKMEPQIQTDLLQRKVDHPYDPLGFTSSASAYKAKLLQGMDPALARGVDQMVDTATQHNLRSLIVEKDAHDDDEQLRTSQAKIKDIDRADGPAGPAGRRQHAGRQRSL